jgi:hypothetical protein
MKTGSPISGPEMWRWKPDDGATKDDGGEAELTRVMRECHLDDGVLAEEPYLDWLVARYRQALREYAAVPMPLTAHIVRRARADLTRAAFARVGS